MIKPKNLCHLCGSDEPLQKSHIIPRSYYKSIKGKSGQLLVVSSDEHTKPELSNSDPKEKLLCRSCEQFLSINFETYGTRLLKDTTTVKRKKDHVIFNNFRFKEFYLYLISILWRASISSIDPYDKVKLGSQINNLLSFCIRNKTLKIQTSLRLDHFLRICLLRVVDKHEPKNDTIIKKTLVGFGVEFGKDKEDGFIYYFMVDGFLVVYFFDIESDIHLVRTKFNYAQIKNKQRIKVPIVDIRELKQISDGFNTIARKSEQRNRS